MKRFHSYEIDPITKTVVITKKFLEEASQIDSQEFELYQKFKAMNLKIIVKTRSTAKKSNSPLRPLNKPVEEKKALVPFAKMAHYISLLDDADEMMDEFDLVRELAKSEEHPRQYVNAWFHEQFPRYEAVPEFDEKHRVIHNPNRIVA